MKTIWGASGPYNQETGAVDLGRAEPEVEAE